VVSSRRVAQSLEQAFASVLRELRHERGLSQERLGLESGSGRTYISQLERGEKTPSLKMIFRLAPPLGVRPGEIVRRVEALLVEP
jgi:transcriptional regulator with XRE-family HTH domain